ASTNKRGLGRSSPIRSGTLCATSSAIEISGRSPPSCQARRKSGIASALMPRPDFATIGSRFLRRATRFGSDRLHGSHSRHVLIPDHRQDPRPIHGGRPCVFKVRQNERLAWPPLASPTVVYEIASIRRARASAWEPI